MSQNAKTLEKPQVKPKDWIEIGARDAIGFAKEAVVCEVYSDSKWADISVVYLSNGGKGKAIKEDLIWKDGLWEFKIKGPNGAYADNRPDLREFVAILRSRKHWR